MTNNRLLKAVLYLCVWMCAMPITAKRVSLVQQDSPVRYRAVLTDKAETVFSLSEPETFLSKEALERRAQQGLSVDSLDLPVCRVYLDKINQLGAHIVTVGKWENFVTFSVLAPKRKERKAIVDSIRSLPFVKEVRVVWRPQEDNFVEHPKPKKRVPLIKQKQAKKESYYGAAERQVCMLRVDSLHAAGFTGKGVKVAVIDGGFHNVDTLDTFKQTTIYATYDFAKQDSLTAYDESDHGLHVLSCMGAKAPYHIVGTAPDAGYYLLRSENDNSEQLVEQDYFCTALEYADSVGVKLVNCSLGYYDFDIKQDRFKLRELDGHHAMISRQCSHAASRGILVVCSAGNSGAKSWKKITPPADAFDVLTVGAVDKDGQLARFSSIGNTVDGRTKPDVVAMGDRAGLEGAAGWTTHGNGTSYAAPTVCGAIACIWQAFPKLTAYEIIDLVRNSGDRVDFPDNIYGYGIPNFWKLYQDKKQSLEK